MLCYGMYHLLWGLALYYLLWGGHYYVDMYHLHMYFVRLYVLGVGAVLCWAVLSARRIGAVLW